MSTLIELQNVKKYYEMGEAVVRALDGISVKVEKGDFIAIMGPSGSGKSTAMNLVGSLDSPTNGQIFLDNKDTAYLDESQLAKIRGQKIGFIFQSFNLISNLTAKENVILPMLFQNLNADEREEQAESLLNAVGIQDRESHYPNQLSGGQQQRVAIARALANNPDVILADEPTGNLDTKTGEGVMQFLEKLNKKGKTIILVTHDPHIAMSHARKIYWLKDGRVEKVTKKVKGKWMSLTKF